MIATLALTAMLMADPPKPSPAATPTPSAGDASQAQPVRYCIQGAPTGTRIARKDCRTRAEWLDRGFDPLAPQE